MTIIKAADDSEQRQCDGCGRIESGPGAPLDAREYIVHDPNSGQPALHHYCHGCAQARALLSSKVQTIPGWAAAPATDVAVESGESD